MGFDGGKGRCRGYFDREDTILEEIEKDGLQTLDSEEFEMYALDACRKFMPGLMEEGTGISSVSPRAQLILQFAGRLTTSRDGSHHNVTGGLYPGKNDSSCLTKDSTRVNHQSRRDKIRHGKMINVWQIVVLRRQGFDVLMVAVGLT